MDQDKGLKKIGDLFDFSGHGSKISQAKKPPAHQWQELALKVIGDLGVPSFKRNSVFKICKLRSKSFVETCLNDTKELCQTGERWKYFFKIASKK
jgi:hypothetical protein